MTPSIGRERIYENKYDFTICINDNNDVEIPYAFPHSGGTCGVSHLSLCIASVLIMI